MLLIISASVGHPIAPEEWHAVNLDLCVNLTTIVFRMEIEDDSEEPDLNLTLCNATLDILALAPPSLRNVWFRFRIFGKGEELLKDPVNMNWTRLEQLLCRISNLQDVMITFRDGTNSTPGTLTNCHVVVEENLSQIKAKNVLRIVYEWYASYRAFHFYSLLTYTLPRTVLSRTLLGSMYFIHQLFPQCFGNSTECMWASCRKLPCEIVLQGLPSPLKLI